MNKMHPQLLKRANEAAILNVYMYLAHKVNPVKYESLNSLVSKLNNVIKEEKNKNQRNIYKLNILNNATKANPALADSVICDMTYSSDGLCGCAFIHPNSEISVIFKGTSKGEWIDNGEGLSGVPESNTYISYDKNKDVIYKEKVFGDFSSDQQVEALNWFYEIINKNNLSEKNHITVSGHSKGGNKAQFVALRSGITRYCFSFDGQGFSPEAISAMKYRYGEDYNKRRSHIYSISSANDYVNVLGNRLVPQKNIYFLKSHFGFHFIESILDEHGHFYPETEQGSISLYAENVSKEIMSLKPQIREYATLGVMNIFQKYIGKGVAVNGDYVSTKKTIAGIGVAITAFLGSLRK